MSVSMDPSRGLPGKQKVLRQLKGFELLMPVSLAGVQLGGGGCGVTTRPVGRVGNHRRNMVMHLPTQWICRQRFGPQLGWGPDSELLMSPAVPPLDAADDPHRWGWVWFEFYLLKFRFCLSIPVLIESPFRFHKGKKKEEKCITKISLF